MSTTDYPSTLITIAPDCPVAAGESPPRREAAPTVAQLQFDMIAAAPYRWTSDDVVFGVWAERRGIPGDDLAAARAEFFSTGQPCLRSSPLGKRYGWGVHSDAHGRVALVSADSDEYRALEADPSVATVAAMRSSRR